MLLAPFLLLNALSAAAPSVQPVQTCTRLCLGSSATVGMDNDERVAFDAALVRALDTERCAVPVAVDGACFSRDACLLSQAHTRGDFVAVRGVRAGGELRLAWATARTGDKKVDRGEVVAPALRFLAEGALDAGIARGACVEQPRVEEPARTAPPAGDRTVPAPLPSLPLIALVSGATFGAIGGVAAVGALVVLETPAAPGGLKEAAFVAGWAGVGTLAVSAAAAGVGAAVYVAEEPR